MSGSAVSRDVPAGLGPTRLAEVAGPEHAAARAFCLAIIKEFYGFDYRPDWHADLDSLLEPPAANQYSEHNRGAFWMLGDAAGAIIATAAIKRLAWRPQIAADLAARYPDPERVASLMRVYVRQDRRGRGLGGRLAQTCEAHARRLGYATMYLHASSDATATVGFWRGKGYAEFGRFGFSTHFDKSLGTASGAPAATDIDRS